MSAGDLILYLDAPAVVMLAALAIYLGREAIAEYLDPAFDRERCRPLQLMALFACMLWGMALDRAMSLARRAGSVMGHDSAWLVTSAWRAAVNLMPFGIALAVLVWLLNGRSPAAPRWTLWIATGAALGLMLRPDLTVRLGEWLYLGLEALHGPG